MSSHERVLNKRYADRYARGLPVPESWRDGAEWDGDDCTCGMCRGRRGFNRYERTGIKPNWNAVAAFRARQDWLRNARRTLRRIVEPPADEREQR